MILQIIRAMLITINIQRSSRAAALSSKAARAERLTAFRHQIIIITKVEVPYVIRLQNRALEAL